MKINVLGVNIDNLNKKEILNKINLFLQDDKQHYITTPNPEFLVDAQKDEEFFYILNKADLSVPDGVGISFALILLGNLLKYRIPGSDLIWEISKIAQNRGESIYLIGGKDKVAEKTANALNKKFTRLRILGAESGPIYKDCHFKKYKEHKYLIERINQKKPTILFVALGHPKQEKWIYHNLPKISSVKLAIGLGGTYDYLSRNISRAPKILRILGLEWMYRLAKEPQKRYKRIFKAVIIFPYLFLKWMFIEPFFYRKNVACLLFKKIDKNIKILLVEREDMPGHWQIPQGGTDGEDIITAGKRELSEEIRTDKFKIVDSFSNLYKYKWSEKNRSNHSKYKHNGYKGQKQSLIIAEFFGKDDDVKINFWEHRNWKWCDINNVLDKVHQTRKEAMRIYLEKFYSFLKKYD